MKEINLYPHPNYIKVVNTYIWFATIVLLTYLFILGLSLVIKFIFAVIIMFLSQVLINSFIKKFSKTKTTIHVYDQYFIHGEKRIEFKDLNFNSFFLEKAYGIGTIISNDFKIRGIHIKEWNKIIES